MTAPYPSYSYNKYNASPFYLIPLEAWRRGLSVTYSGDMKNYSVSSPERRLIFRRSMVLDAEWGLQTLEITRNKDDTKQYLFKANVAVPQGKRFNSETSSEEIIRYAEQIGFPVVLKPTNGYRGEGVFSNVSDAVSLKQFLIHVRRDLGFEDVIVEERIEGDDFRIFVLGDKVLAALKRIPLNVTGNGKDTIKQLIHTKNYERKHNRIGERKPIKIDPEILTNIKLAGYHINSVLEDGQTLFLRVKCNLSLGGDSIDVTDELPQHVENTAIMAVKAIPGLKHAGVDLLYDDSMPNRAATVIEINSMAEIGAHLFPRKGVSRDIAAALLDHYFPESTGAKQNHRMVFFDPYSLRNRLLKNPEAEITLPALPSEEMVRREITVLGRVQGGGFRRWAEKQAIRMNLSGYVENRGRNSLHIVVAGDAEQVKAFEALCRTGPGKTRIEKISSRNYDEAVLFGFSIIRKDNVLLDTIRRVPKAILRRMVKLKKTDHLS